MLKRIGLAAVALSAAGIAYYAGVGGDRVTAGAVEEAVPGQESLSEVFDFSGRTLSAAGSQDFDQGASRIERAVEGARGQGRYLFVYFHRTSDFEKLMPIVREARSKWADRAYFMEVNVNDPAERQHVSRYRIRSTPLLLALAPNGAVTAGFGRNVTLDQIERAFVPEAVAEVMVALQERQTVFLVIGNEDSAHFREVVDAVEGSVSLLEGIAQGVILAPNEEASELILRNAGFDDDSGATQTLVISPGGGVVARFTGQVTQRELLDSFSKVLSQSKGCGARTVTGGSPCEPGRGVAGGRGCGARAEG